jgi:signal transduction histidine kinase
LLFGFGVLLLSAFTQAPQQAAAGAYGRGSYGNCTYQGCAAKAKSTQLTLPSGLEVSVNLVNGQTIPQDGYTIIVTPLNGAGISFKQVDFYINGKLVQGGVQPDDTGTASWKWDPTLYPGSKVTVVVTDTDGNTITKEFDVKVGEKAAAPATAANTPEQTTGISSVLRHVSNGAKRVIRALPRPVVYSFPYILFVLLGVNALVLLFQAKREVGEYRTLQAILARLRAISEGKKSFLALVSHYLRTPLTVVASGVEMLQGSDLVTSSVVDLKAVSDRLRKKIELLIDQINMSTTTAPAVAASGSMPANVQVWRQPGLLVPVLLIGAAGFGFTYLTARAGSFSITQVNVAIQIIVFFILALTTYQVLRRIQLHKRDAALLQQVVQQEEAEAQSRDELITITTTALNDDLQTLDKAMAATGDTKAVSFIRRGQSQFHDLMAKFTLVSGLHGGRSSKPFAPAQLADMLDRAGARVKPAMVSRGITVAANNGELSFPVQDVPLLLFVMQSLLDNAVAYSPDNATIEVEAQSSPSGTTLTITDHGAGIPPEKQMLLFRPFSKAEDAETFNHEGIGLSLYIDRLIMAYLGGAIELQSKPGLTIATLHLPAPGH